MIRCGLIGGSDRLRWLDRRLTLLLHHSEARTRRLLISRQIRQAHALQARRRARDSLRLSARVEILIVLVALIFDVVGLLLRLLLLLLLGQLPTDIRCLLLRWLLLLLLRQLPADVRRRLLSLLLLLLLLFRVALTNLPHFFFGVRSTTTGRRALHVTTTRSSLLNDEVKHIRKLGGVGKEGGRRRLNKYKGTKGRHNEHERRSTMEVRQSTRAVLHVRVR